MTLPASAGQRVAGAILSGVKSLGRAFPGSFVIASIFHVPKAGEGSDKVRGRDMAALFSHPATGTMLPKNHTLKPGDKSVNLPVRGELVNHNGQMAVKLVKTGKGSVPAQVPVLKAVRDPKTGLDRITLPAVAGRPSQTILINPVPVKTGVPPVSGRPAAVPQTPVHTGTVVKPVTRPVIMTTPAVPPGALSDFIYWRLNASGTGVEPVYVMLSDPLDSGKYTRRQLQKKFKHAVDFGISDTKINSETLAKFRNAIEAHLSDKNTKVKGTYIREKDSKVYFNSKTNNAVVIKKDGSFSTGMKLVPGTPQYRNYIEKGVLL